MLSEAAALSMHGWLTAGAHAHTQSHMGRGRTKTPGTAVNLLAKLLLATLYIATMEVKLFSYEPLGIMQAQQGMHTFKRGVAVHAHTSGTAGSGKGRSETSLAPYSCVA